MHNWNFDSRRALLASVTMPYTMWKYAYAVPGDMMVAVSVLPHDAENDYSAKFPPSDNPDFLHNYAPLVAAGRYVPQPYSIETTTAGNKVLYTDQQNALLRYQALITDPTKFDPLFAIALSHHLAGMLAGPVIKGTEGATEGKRQTQLALGYVQMARASDSNQRNQAIGALMLAADYIVTASLSVLEACHYLGLPHPVLFASLIIVAIGIINFFGPRHADSRDARDQRRRRHQGLSERRQVVRPE